MAVEKQKVQPTRSGPPQRTVANRASDFATAVLLLLAVSAALFGALIQPAKADVSAVSGSAVGYLANVGLFGGPATQRGPAGSPGCDPNQAAPGPNSSPTEGCSPQVSLPAGGSSSPVSTTDSDGARAVYGPAVLFGGQWPNAAAIGPPSGPITVSTQGTTGADGSVTSSAQITLAPTNGTWTAPGTSSPEPWVGGVGPGPLIADGVESTCTASQSGVSGSTTITNGKLAISTDSQGNPANIQPMPPNPAPNDGPHHGEITNVGDNFDVFYNEQTHNPDGSLTVTAIHMKLNGPTAVGDLWIARSTCGVAATASTSTTTAASSTTTSSTPTSSATSAPTSTARTPATPTTTASPTLTASSIDPGTSSQATAPLTTTSASPNTTATTVATAASGRATGYRARVSLFGGPPTERGPAGTPGCDANQPPPGPSSNSTEGCSATVTLPAGGSSSPVSTTESDGARAVYGPAVLFGGQWPENDPIGPPSGPITVSTEGTGGANGNVSASAEISLAPPGSTWTPPGTSDPKAWPGGIGPGPLIADGIKSTCSASGSGVGGTTTITNGNLATATDHDGNPTNLQPMPANPSPNDGPHHGEITNVGDNFDVFYNEQTKNADGSLTVSAIHMKLNGPTAVGDLWVGQVTCGLTASGGVTVASAGGASGTTGSGTGSGGRFATTGAEAARETAVALDLIVVGWTMTRRGRSRPIRRARHIRGRVPG